MILGAVLTDLVLAGNDMYLDHKIAAQLHANNRARERLGIHFNRHIARGIIDKIKAKDYGRGVATPDCKYRLWYKAIDIDAWILYDSKLNRIVTVLPIEVIPYCIVERGKDGKQSGN